MLYSTWYHGLSWQTLEKQLRRKFGNELLDNPAHIHVPIQLYWDEFPSTKSEKAGTLDVL